MAHKLPLALCACALFLNSGLAYAAPVFTQPADPSGSNYASQNDTGGGGNFATAYDNFTLGTSSVIRSLRWVGGYFNGAPGTITAFTVNIYADSLNQPGAILSSSAISGNGNETSIASIGGHPTFQYSANLTPFAATAATQYWIAVIPDLTNPPQWGWNSGLLGDNYSYQEFNGPLPPQTHDFAFTLDDAILPVAPEIAPGSAATPLLMLFFATCLTGSRRRGSRAF